MSVTTILDYKVNEADLKKWLETNFGSAGGTPSFSYKPSEQNKEQWAVTAPRTITKADVEDMKKMASGKLSSKYAGAVEF